MADLDLGEIRRIKKATGTTVNDVVVALCTGAQTASFGGQTVSPTDVLIMYTYNGDANLSGNVDADDYFQTVLAQFNIEINIPPR